jgi:hypothetical protein
MPTRARSSTHNNSPRWHSNAALSLSVLLLICSVTDWGAQAANANHDFRFCPPPGSPPGNFALCAASICTPTGKKIMVNGSNIPFDEADCLCPVFSGTAIADVAGGNMNGSCDPPPPPPSGQVWSLYAFMAEIPQQINDWSTTPAAAAAPFLFCPKSLNLGRHLVNCFSFACDPPTTINGVLVATCHCPIAESLDGTQVPAHTAFLSQAGQGDPAFCAEYPVSGPISFPNQ